MKPRTAMLAIVLIASTMEICADNNSSRLNQIDSNLKATVYEKYKDDWLYFGALPGVVNLDNNKAYKFDIEGHITDDIVKFNKTSSQIYIECFKANDKDIDKVCLLHNLVGLKLVSSSITKSGIAALCNNNIVEQLDMNVSNNLKSNDFKCFGKMSSLQQLTVRYKCDDEMMGYISKIPSLTKLRIDFSKEVTTKAIKHLQKCNQLKSIHLVYCQNIDDLSLKEISKITKIQEIIIDTCMKVTDIGIGYLTACKSLKHLTLSGRTDTARGDFRLNLTDKSLGHIANITSLECLRLGYLSSISDKGLIGLVHLKNLKNFSVVGCKINDRGLSFLKKLDIEELNVSENDLEGSFLKNINEKSIKKLYIIMEDIRVSRNIINHFNEISKFKNLEVLSLRGLHFSDENLSFLGDLKNLRELDVSCSQYLEGSFLNKINNKIIKKLNLERTEISMAYAQNLIKLDKLTWLSLEGCNNLRNPNIAGVLKNLKSLRHLNLSMIFLSETIINKIQESLPRCKIEL